MDAKIAEMLTEIPFEEIERQYMDVAVHTLDLLPDEKYSEEEIDDKIIEEYQRMMEMSICERAEYSDPLGNGVIPVQYLDLPNFSIYGAVLFSSMLNCAECLELNKQKIDGYDLYISVFTIDILRKKFGDDARITIEEIKNRFKNFLIVRQQKKKFMFLFLKRI